MKSKPVRVCDVSRLVRIPSSSLIEFLREKGFSILSDYLSPLSSRMLELIQNGYNEGPPFQELNALFAQSEEWEKLNPEIVERLHAPPPPPPRPTTAILPEDKEYRPRRQRQPRISFQPAPQPAYTGRIPVTPLDLELIQRVLDLGETKKMKVRDYLRRKTIMEAISRMDKLL
jgi:hypothetical protein